MSHIYYRHTDLKSVLNEINVKEATKERIIGFLKDEEAIKTTLTNENAFDTSNYDLVHQLALEIVGENFSLGNDMFFYFKDCTLHYVKTNEISIMITKNPS